MSAKVVIFALILCSAISERTYPSYKQYAQTFKKVFNSESDYIYRKSIYQSRIQQFKTITDYQPGVNSLTDRSKQQIEQLKNLNQVQQNQRLKRPPPPHLRLAAPQSFDWRDFGAITPIRNQEQCGSCWAFATAAHAESKVIIQKRFTNSTINLSQQYIISCSKYSSCSGGYLEYSMKAGLKVPSESSYPYNPYYSQPNGICNSEGVSVGTGNFDYYGLTDAQIIPLLLESPVAISISAVGWQSYGSGIFRCAQNSKVNHAVQLIGYTSQYWIIKNQWGPYWGERGFMRITRQRANNCGIGKSVHILRGTTDSSRDKDFVYSIEQNTSGGIDVATDTTLPKKSSQSSIKAIFLVMLLVFYIIF